MRKFVFISISSCLSMVFGVGWEFCCVVIYFGFIGFCFNGLRFSYSYIVSGFDLFGVLFSIVKFLVLIMCCFVCWFMCFVFFCEVFDICVEGEI